MANTRPRLSVSLDLDNLWSYMKTHGDPGWEALPSYLDDAADVILERFSRHGLTATVFVVGQDAALAKNRAALRRIADAGHEIGNHSFHHEPWLHEYSRADVEEEIASSEAHIEDATGRRPRGFRGPGYSVTADTLAVLSARGYLYDASTLPTFLGPVARAYYFWQSRGLSRDERAKRSRLFGSVSDGLRPIDPYLWDLGDRQLLEIPVTTMPGVRAPIHLSYLLYLASLHPEAARAYLRTAMALCAATGVEPSFLLHPLDFLGGDRVRELSFFPGMNLPTARKLALFDEVIATLRGRFELVTMEAHARALLAGGAALKRVPAALVDRPQKGVLPS